MRVLGVVCEYNPFHRGHAYHLAEARRLSGAEIVVCAMSGPLTQRGTFARHDKWLRARAALQSGADLVVELPVRFACAPAPDFASGGVTLLAALGMTHLSFGCEPEALPLLAGLPQETPAFREALRAALGRGLSYPRAREEALLSAGTPPETARLLSSPNAILASEYLRALPEGVTAVPVPRIGCAHDDLSLGAFPSASALRAALASCDPSRGLPPEAEAALPEAEAIALAERARRVHPEEGLTALLLHRLRTAGPEALSRIYGMDEGLEHRFLRAARKAGTREALLGEVKTKRYTHARLSRVCACTLLGLTKDFAAAHRQPTYARVLGFRKSALPLLHGLRDGPLPLVTKCADADASDPLFALDVLAQDLWALGCENPACRAAGQDYTTSPVRL